MVWAGIWSMSRRALNHAEKHASPSAAAATGRLDGGHVVDDEPAAILTGVIADAFVTTKVFMTGGGGLWLWVRRVSFRLDFRVRALGDVVQQGFTAAFVAVADSHGFRVEWENISSCGSAAQKKSDRTRRGDSFSTKLFSISVPLLGLRDSGRLRRSGRHRPRPAGQVRHRVRPAHHGMCNTTSSGWEHISAV